MRSTEERLAGYEQDLFDVREQLEAITQVVALDSHLLGAWETVRKTVPTKACLYVGKYSP